MQWDIQPYFILWFWMQYSTTYWYLRGHDHKPSKRSVWDHNVTHMHSLSLHVSESVTIRSKQRLVGWLQWSWRCGIDISDLGVFPLYPSFLLSPHEDPGAVRDEQSCTCRDGGGQIAVAPILSGSNASGSASGGKKTWMYVTFCILPSHLRRCFFLNETFFRS